MTSYTPQRTKQRALAVLLDEITSIRSAIADRSARQALTDRVVTEIFEVVWRRQFDEYRNEATRQVREIVDIAIDSLKEGTS